MTLKISRAIGIDLGTTNSAAAIMNPQGSEIILLEDRFKRKTLPSMVGWDPSQDAYITGWEAWNRRTLSPQPVASIKRKMGQQQHVRIGDEEFLPEDVSARILERLVKGMRSFVETRFEQRETTYLVESAVITIPAYFDAPQIEATRRAGEIAGIEVIGLLQEPTAAAMYHAWKHGVGDGNFLVYDLGGGTFDVSVIRCLMGEYQVLGIEGDNYLGGDDFDRRLAEYLRQHLVEQGWALDLDVAGNDDDRTRFELLKRIAQEAKEALSDTHVHYIGRRNVFDDQEGESVSIETEIARDVFEELIDDLVDQTLRACERALLKSAQAADVTLADIDYVLLVGGSTRLPLVQRKVAEAFCGEKRSRATQPLIDEPDTCVALGAAIHASNIAGLRIEDDERAPGASLSLSSSLATDSSSHRIAGRLVFSQEAEGGAAEAIESVVVIDHIGEIAAIARPEPEEDGLFFSVEEVELGQSGRHEFSLEFCDSDGDPLYAFTLQMTRLEPGERMRHSGSALSNPSVLAKDIYLEVVQENKAARHVLLRNGESLPARQKYRFYTGDRSGAVTLRLFQNRFPIRTIHLTVPDGTEVGTPVDLDISVDETMAMTVSGEVSGQTFWAQIEQPPPAELKDWSQIEALLERCDVVARELWGHEATYFREETRHLIAGIRETARTDPDKLQILVRRLEEVVDDFHERDAELTPGWGRYEHILFSIKRVVFRGDEGLKLGTSAEEWGERLGSIHSKAERAFEARDQREWSQVFNQVQAIWESLAQDEYMHMRSDPEQYAHRLYTIVGERLADLNESLDEFVFSSNPETKTLQQERMRALRDEVTSKVASPLRHVDVNRMGAGPARHELDKLYETIKYIERELEHLPTIGLVRK